MQQLRTPALCFALLLCFFPLMSHAQGCPPPENLHIRILPGPPPAAEVNWTIPPGGNVTGFIFTYTIDGGIPIVLNLPLNPAQYTVPLPEDWQEIHVSLVSVCADGSTSDIAETKVNNIIITDLVLAQQDGREAQVCTGVCPGSTHFFYSQMSGGEPGGINTYRNNAFCFCMGRNGNNYQNPAIVDACRQSALEVLDPVLNYLTICRPAGQQRSAADAAPIAKWYPNPVTEVLHLEFDNGSQLPVSCIISNSTGSCVHLISEFSTPALVSVAGWKPGVYFIRLQMPDGQVQTGKFCKF